MDTAGASEELTTAAEYQRKAGRRAACLMMILVVVVAIVLLAVRPLSFLSLPLFVVELSATIQDNGARVLPLEKVIKL